MGNFNRNSRSGGRRNSGGFSGRNSGRPAMHKAVCSECGNDCELPFRPTGGKPVYCSDCFENKGGSSPKNFGRRETGRFDKRDKKMYRVICDKCNKECEVPFQPSNDKPVYCSECFGISDKGKSSGHDNKQFDKINAKLDIILKALNLKDNADGVEKEEKVKKAKVVKTAKTAESKESKKKVTKSKETKKKEKKAVAPKKAKAKKKK